MEFCSMIHSPASIWIAATSSPPPAAVSRAPRPHATAVVAAPLRRAGGPRKCVSCNRIWRMASLEGQAEKTQRVEDEASKVISKVAIATKDDKLRRELYPGIDANKTGFLKVSDLHTLYWEESGNAAGQPVIFLHGGPGAGTSGGNRRFFDPQHYRILLLDQRGAGKSTPHACTEENTTWDLVGDIEKLREHLGIEKWTVFGGSWGSTLTLTYAETHPERVAGIILRGIFLLRKKEIDWFYQSGTSSIFPDAWEPYRDFIPEDERDDFLTAYSKRLNSSDRAVQSFSVSSSKGMDKLGDGDFVSCAQCRISAAG